MKHDPFDAMYEPLLEFTSIFAFTYSVGPSSVVWTVKQTWTSSTFSTNESAWSAMVTGSQSRMWSGPKLVLKLTRVAPNFDI